MEELPKHLHYPQVRQPLDIQLEKIEGEDLLILRCPLGLTQKPLLLKPFILPVLQRFTGNASINSIQEELQEQGATQEIILQIAQLLDEELFLEGPKFQQAKQEQHQLFLNASVRESALAGLSYPAKREALEQQLNEYLALGENAPVVTGDRRLRCLMTPHIDYHRGHLCYGNSFRVLRNQNPDCVLLIGTGHQYSPHLFHLTKKDFKTPLGILKNADALMEEIGRSYGEERSYADEYLHKQEHSLELQTPFMTYLIPDAEILPVLVGGFHHMLMEKRTPKHYEPYHRFVESLAETIEKHLLSQGKHFMVVAGVDMAHIGQFFGDQRELSDGWMEEIAQRDREYLSILEAEDEDALFEHIAYDQDERRVCGFPTMYTVLDLLKRLNLRGDVKHLDYRQAVNRSNGCAVTFGGMAFYEGERER
jgi:AmmeMemoRadiSam system protein B